MTGTSTLKISKRNFCLFLVLVFCSLMVSGKNGATENWLKFHLSPGDLDVFSQSIKITYRSDNQWHSSDLEFSVDESSSSYTAHLKLGNITNVEILKILWPTEELQVLRKVVSNQDLILRKPQFPNPPSNVFARVISTTQIDLVWKDNSDNELGFSIERSRFKDKGFKEIGRVGTDINYYSDKTVEKNSTYYYRVRAISEKGLSLFDSAYQKTEENTGLVLEDVSQPLRMYPNPNKNFLDVRVNNEIMGHVLVKFLDNDGKELKTMKFIKKIKDLKTKVDISSLPFGIYMVEISLVTYKSLIKS